MSEEAPATAVSGTADGAFAAEGNPVQPTQLADLLAPCVADLVRRSHSLLPRAARTYVGAEDLVQDVLLMTCRRAGHLRVQGEAGLMPYLQRGLTNRARSEFRRLRRRDDLTARFGSSDPIARSPLDELLERERRTQVREALKTLPPLARALIVARFAHEMGWHAIAERYDLSSPDAARLATRRAVARLEGQITANVLPSA